MEILIPPIIYMLVECRTSTSVFSWIFNPPLFLGLIHWIFTAIIGLSSRKWGGWLFCSTLN